MTEATALRDTAAPGSGLALHRNVALAMLFVVGTINFVDRQLLAMLIEPIRADIALSDTQFGLLTGLAFALFYAGMGVPVAILADRWNRVRLIGIACILWSGFTAACGLVSNFWQLALMRFGVGAGEAGGTAPSVSVLADYYPPDRRPVAMALFTCNGPFGVFVGAAFGAWAAAAIGWRNAFLVIGAVGILVGPLLIWLVHEPARGQMDQSANDDPVPFARALGLFRERRSLMLVLPATAFAAFVSYGMLNWIPAYLMRVQAMPLAAMGTWFAPVAGITFAAGTLGGGWLVARLSQRSPRAYGRVPAIATAILIPSLIAALTIDGWPAALALMIVPLTACTFYIAPSLALVQNLTPPRARATATAILMLMFNIVGLGFGPLFVGFVSDMLKPDHGIESLRWGLMALIPFAVAACAVQIAMMRHLDRDFAA
ncbi:MFS transporter [Sphingopyxis sp. DBS4]|uniref:spinster family MFS transporter n=1 Tax=Sphingopyxis sp. DBS4 TaxID=2968500 RepID=UPI00214B655D|nr:MFS transporter [Sphingopyxis sp. DBS4]